LDDLRGTARSPAPSPPPRLPDALLLSLCSCAVSRSPSSMLSRRGYWFGIIASEPVGGPSAMGGSPSGAGGECAEAEVLAPGGTTRLQALLPPEPGSGDCMAGSVW